MADSVIDNCGYYKYLGGEIPSGSGRIKEIDYERAYTNSYQYPPLDSTFYTESHSVPRVLTRNEKGQALTHQEMDFNLASFLHTLNTSSKGDPYAAGELEPIGEEQLLDPYHNCSKPTREEEMEGLFATFSYAPIVDGTASVIQNPFQTIKIQHTTDEIRYKLSNEEIPGYLRIAEDFMVTGSTQVRGNLAVTGSGIIEGNLKVTNDTETNTLHALSSSVLDQDLSVGGTASFEGDVYILGNLYVNGVYYGNLSQKEYKSNANGEYAKPIVDVAHTSSQPTRYYTQEEVDQLLATLKAEILAKIHDS